MADPFVGEIRMFAGNFAPLNWAFCDGQTVAIAENDALFALIGTTYGGDGVTTFNLPDLRGRIPHHQGTTGATTLMIGQRAGAESVTLTGNQLPMHSHAVVASSNAASTTTPAGNRWASWADNPYSTATPDVQLDATSVSSVGGNQPHENMPPFLAVSFIISLYGIFPAQS